MFRKLNNLWQGLKWLARGCPLIYYKGYACGCCGSYWSRPFVIPDFQSVDEWWDTWGLCPKGKGCREGEVY